MKLARLLRSKSVLVLALAASTLARAEVDCAKLCAIPTGKERLQSFVVIDANTGQILEGSTHFKEGEQVQVIVVRKNPFHYAYRTEIVSEPLDIAIPKSFFDVVPAFSNLLAHGAAAGPGAGKASPCSGNLDALEYEKEAQRIAGEGNALPGKIATSYDAFKVVTAMDFRQSAECKPACQKATDLTSNVDALDELKSSLRALQGKDFTKFEKVPSDDCQKELGASKQAATEAVDAADKKIADVKPVVSKVKEVLASETSFVEVQYPQTVGEPTGVTITLFRQDITNKDAKERQIAVVHVQVGESPFSVSGGVGFTTIEDTHFIRQAFLKSDGTIGAQFGEENQSNFLRPSLVLSLNAQLWKRWGWSTGLVLSERNGTTRAEFVLGPCFYAVPRGNFVIGLGYHLAQVEELGGGFAPGQEIPAGLTDPLPVETNWKGGVMLSFTYKLR